MSEEQNMVGGMPRQEWLEGNESTKGITAD